MKPWLLTASLWCYKTDKPTKNHFKDSAGRTWTLLWDVPAASLVHPRALAAAGVYAVQIRICPVKLFEQAHFNQPRWFKASAWRRWSISFLCLMLWPLIEYNIWWRQLILVLSSDCLMALSNVATSEVGCGKTQLCCYYKNVGKFYVRFFFPTLNLCVFCN